MEKSQELIKIEESLRRAAEAVRRRDPDTLAGRVGNAARKTPPTSGKAPQAKKDKSRT